MPSSLRSVLVGPAAAAELRAAIGEAKASDPLAPVTVAVPSTYSGLSLRRALVRGAGLINVRFSVLAGVAEMLGAPTLAMEGRMPLTSAIRVNALVASLSSQPGPFARALGHPAALRALVTRLCELSEVGAALGTGALIELAAEVRRRTEPHYYDTEDLARAAAASVREGTSGLVDVGHLIIYQPQRLSPAYLDLLGSLQSVGRLTAILVSTGDAAADRPNAELMAALAEAMEVDRPSLVGDVVGGAVPGVERIIVAPDADIEVRLVVQEVAARMADGVALPSMAVLYRSASPYARLLHEQLAAAGLPIAGPGIGTLAQSVSGRTLVALLGLAAEDYSRQSVMAVLNGGPMRGGLAVSAWERMSRDANIVRGAHRWEQRLTHLAARLRSRADIDGAEQVDHFRNWVGALVERCGGLDQGSWSAVARFAGEWLDDVLDVDALDDAQTEAHQQVLDALDRLAAAEAFGVAASGAALGLAQFMAALEIELASTAGRVGAFGQGVFVGPLSAAVGTVWDVVFVVGMAEGAFPPRRVDDPLLPDSHRVEAGLKPAARQHHRDTERRDYLSVLATAPARVLSAPRSDQRSHRPTLPARWCIEAASVRAGRSLLATDLIGGHASWPWLDVVASLTDALARPPADPTGVRIALLAAGVTAEKLGAPSLARGLAAVEERASGGLGRWEGLVGLHPLLAIDPGAPLSPTSLQTWAQCPRRYLFDRVLRVRETARPEEVLQLNALDRGTLVHDALEIFFREKATSGELGSEWTDTDRSRLLAIVAARCAEVEAQGLTGKPVLWALQRDSLLAHLSTFLDRDATHRAGTDLVPEDFEVGFGGTEDEIGSVPFTVGSRTLRFKGRIDRIDAASDHSAVEVIDYKTGSAERFKVLDVDCVDGGRLLQLPVYALAASQLYPHADISASYWFVTDTESKHQHKPVPLDAATRGRFADVIGHIADGIEDGVFPGNPGPDDRDSWENCRYCPYDRVCPTQRDEVWERVALSDEASSYRHLRHEAADAAADA